MKKRERETSRYVNIGPKTENGSRIENVEVGKQRLGFMRAFDKWKFSGENIHESNSLILFPLKVKKSRRLLKNLGDVRDNQIETFSSTFFFFSDKNGPSGKSPEPENFLLQNFLTKLKSLGLEEEKN